MITNLYLYNYRNFGSLNLELHHPHVVLYGKNGSGKTNILEAISLFSMGRGLRSSPPQEIQSLGAGGWSVKMDLKLPNDSDLNLKTSLEPQLDGSLKRYSKIQDEAIKSHTSIAEWMTILWITPESDRLFLDTPSARRKFVDRFVYAQDPLHLKRVATFENATRQRLKLLKTEGLKNPDWLSAYESIIAKEGVEITLARQALLKTLSEFVPKGAEEQILTTFTASMDFDMDEETYRLALQERRLRDMDVGMTTLGPHRSDLSVHHHKKDMSATLCSTGEQKILLLALIIAFMEKICLSSDKMTFFLLDDVMAHLDESHRFVLFHRLLNHKNFQAWFSGTDRFLFADLEGKATFLNVEN